MTSRTSHTIAIIGAGASGTLVAAQLLRQSQHPLHLLLIEPRALVGRGIAYSTTNDQHLLNIPVGKMSAYADVPDHFLQWLTKQLEIIATPEMLHTSAFVPRQFYGRYLQAVLEEAMKASHTNSVLEHICDEALTLHRTHDGIEIALKSGRRLHAQQGILALGTLAPQSPFVSTPAFYRSVRYHGDPWSPEVLSAIPATSPVLFLGTGLTMVDLAVALKAQGHTGSLLAVSRHGLLPYSHRPHSCPSPNLPSEEFPATARTLLRWVRVACQEAMNQDVDWRCVIDALRPHVQKLWQSWSSEEKQRFLRHAQPYWDVRRHRIAPAMATTIAKMCNSEQLRIYAGRIQSYEETHEGVNVTLRTRQSRADIMLSVHHAINCTGPNTDVQASEHPLLTNLLAQGMIRPDPLHLGLEVTAEDAIAGSDDTSTSSLYTLGSLRKGDLWETTAIPEIRQQAEELAYTLLT